MLHNIVYFNIRFFLARITYRIFKNMLNYFSGLLFYIYN